MDDQEEAYFLSQIPESSGSRFRASKISAVLRKVIQQKGYSAIQSADMLRNAWADAVGQSLASQTQVGKVERGQLTVLAANKVVASELDYMKSQILKSLKEKLPEFSIRTLRVRCDAHR